MGEIAVEGGEGDIPWEHGQILGVQTGHFCCPNRSTMDWVQTMPKGREAGLVVSTPSTPNGS